MNIWYYIFLSALLSGCKGNFERQDPEFPAGISYFHQGDTLSWYRPRFTDRKAERERMVRKDLSEHPWFPIHDKKVLEAMRQVPRHEFVPEILTPEAYLNTPLPVGFGQTISQPFIVAHMTYLLNVEPGDRILEIGTGTGYQAAVLTELTPYIYSVEIVPELAESARQTLYKLGYRTVKIKTGDGYEGWSEFAPFDGIIVTCAPEDIPRPLIEQLKPGGRIVIPVGGQEEIQYLVVVEKNDKGKIRTKRQYPVRFVPMKGKALKPQ